MINIAVIARSIGSKRWEPLVECLDGGVEHGCWTYTKFDIDKFNRVEFDKLTFDHHILVGTKPVSETVPHTRFLTSASEEEIYSRMQTLVDTLCGENEDGNSVDNSVADVPVRETSDAGDSECTSVCDPSDSDVKLCLVPDPNCDNLPDHQSTVLEQCDYLIGVKIDINGREVLLDYKEAIKLKEMMEIMKEYGYQITDVITHNISGDD